MLGVSRYSMTLALLGLRALSVLCLSRGCDTALTTRPRRCDARQRSDNPLPRRDHAVLHRHIEVNPGTTQTRVSGRVASQARAALRSAHATIPQQMRELRTHRISTRLPRMSS
eukprot:COSAG06_NODE_2360_length_7005_cov_13.853026_5_plen_113_part_00